MYVGETMCLCVFIWRVLLMYAISSWVCVCVDWGMSDRKCSSRGRWCHCSFRAASCLLLQQQMHSPNLSLFSDVSPHIQLINVKSDVFLSLLWATSNSPVKGMLGKHPLSASLHWMLSRRDIRVILLFLSTHRHTYSNKWSTTSEFKKQKKKDLKKQQQLKSISGCLFVLSVPYWRHFTVKKSFSFLVVFVSFFFIFYFF